jgi:hypothetical protein
VNEAGDQDIAECEIHGGNAARDPDHDEVVRGQVVDQVGGRRQRLGIALEQAPGDRDPARPVLGIDLGNLVVAVPAAVAQSGIGREAVEHRRELLLLDRDQPDVGVRSRDHGATAGAIMLPICDARRGRAW